MNTLSGDLTQDLARARRALGLLVLLTLVATLLTTDPVRDLASVRVLSSVAAGLAFVKARFVVLDFMDLSETVLQRVLDVWLLVVGAAAVALLLR